jgi:N-methylhydantoinase B/oxoprolinase/acetone carboxylase alpha subunit
VPDRVAAGGYGTCLNVAGGGWDPERRQPFGFYLFQEGGWGATTWRDGWSSVPNPTSNFNDYPVEVVESELPLRYREVSLHEGSGGAGRFRGGLGTRRVVEVLAEECELSALGERFTSPPFGLDGGEPGRPNALGLQRRGEDALRPFDEAMGTASPSKFASLPLQQGDVVALVTGGGGGYGDPFTRDAAAVAADVRAGLVTAEAARRDYGVVLGGEGGWHVDEAATATLRATPRRPRAPLPPAREPLAPPALRGPEAEDVARVGRLTDAVRARIADDPCRTTCVKQGDPVRCPFHHPFAVEFWDAHGLERWSARHCPIVRERR